MRLSKFGKCQSQETAEFNNEGSEENLNGEDQPVVVVDGKKADEPITDQVKGENNIFTKAWVRAKLPRSQSKQSANETRENGGGQAASGSREGTSEADGKKPTTEPPRFSKAWVTSRLKMK